MTDARETETIKTYQGPDVGVSQCLVTLEGFIGDMDNAELADDSTVDTGEIVIAINGLIWAMEHRETHIEQLEAEIAHWMAESFRLRAAIQDIADKEPGTQEWVDRIRMYDEDTDLLGSVFIRARAALAPTAANSLKSA